MNNFKIYILLTDTGTLLNRLIKLFTKKPYNHASIAFDSDLNEVYSFGRKQPRNPFIGGFVKENTREDQFKNASCAIYCANVTKEQYMSMKQLIESIEEDKDRYRYNFLGLFSFITKRQINRKNALFCSQFVATVLQETNVIHFEKPLSLIAPHEIPEKEIFSLVYQGDLTSYHRIFSTNEIPASLNVEENSFMKIFLNRTYTFYN